MLFNEIYSAYYNAVAKVISQIIAGKTDEKILNDIIRENAFGESVLTVLPSLKSGKWQLLRPDMTTPIKNNPTMPLTVIQKQWLKAISLDPRIRLFNIDFSFLGGVEPLFTPDDFTVYDKYSDGDPFEDEEYQNHFLTILTALKTRQSLKIVILNRKGDKLYIRCIPESLEYSEKDDKFRLVTSGCSFVNTVNVAKIIKCKICNENTVISSAAPTPEYAYLTLKVREERNTLERCMLHFAHFEKKAEKTGNHYLLHIKYDKADESEIVIRVLSFGPMVEAISPENFRQLIKDKLKSQKSCEHF